MSQYNGSSLRGFDPFAIHPFTSGAGPTADSSYYGADASTLPSPPASPRPIPMGFGSSPSGSHTASSPNPVDLRPGTSIGSSSSYNDHLTRAMNAPPQTFLASQQLPAPSWPEVPGFSTPLSPSSSSSSSASPSPRPPPTHVFTDFRAEVERYRRQGGGSASVDEEDLPVLKKKRERVYAGF